MSVNFDGRFERDQSAEAKRNSPDDHTMAASDTVIAPRGDIEAPLRAPHERRAETVARDGCHSHAHDSSLADETPSTLLLTDLPATEGSTSPLTRSKPPRTRAYYPNSPPLPVVERKHVLFSFIVLLFAVISATALLAPVLIIVSPKPLRDFAEDAMVKATTILEGAKTASNRKRAGHVERKQVKLRSAKLAAIEKRGRDAAQSARLTAAAEQRRLLALEAQRAFAAESRRLAARNAAAARAKRAQVARQQRLTAEAENRRLAALVAQRAFTMQRRREAAASTHHDLEAADGRRSVAPDVTVTFAATGKTVSQNDVLFKPPVQPPVRAVGQVMPHGPSLIVRAGDVMAATQILIGRPTARAQKTLANGFVLTSAIKRQTLRSAWRDIVSRRVSGRPYHRRRARAWFTIAWRDASDSHYVLAIANGNSVASLHIRSPLDKRKELSRAEQRAMIRIACATSFGDVALPCARQ